MKPSWPRIIPPPVLKRIAARTSVSPSPTSAPASAPRSPTISPSTTNTAWMSPSVSPKDFRIAMSRVFSYTTVEIML